ncbi:DUF5312 family protein [Breznakiella homolactica]|uniref:Uncharacterized protein n=1 Tax=Breznakiella homolactica TaxID=2798577 RepID=A0A7T7XRG6_9SPIR|nr:DUF5312 family protein [Breznakiella homolactica]QQO11131.1 DUF5312 domain-containing protein [Breznakiella homolactica]
MEDGGVFNRLVSELSLSERGRLLSKLNSHSELTQEPLYVEEKGTAALDIKQQYEKTPWYMRLFYLIVGIFKSKTPESVFEDRLVARLGAIIDDKSPGLYDYRRELLLPDFQKELVGLKENSRFFYNALDVSVNRDKGAFFVFLASLEMPEIHKQLSEDTDPLTIARSNPGSSESEVHQKSLRTMENILNSITDDQRGVMYYNARSLYCLKELSSFLFDRIVNAFSFEPSAAGPACAVRLVRDQLVSLNNVLYSMSHVPSMPLLESLFVFMLQDHMGDVVFDVESEIKTLLSRAEVSLGGIRRFNKTVPLTLIIRCAVRNMALSPKAIPGGEDWFAVYRDYWKKQIDDQYREFAKTRKQKNLAEAFKQFLMGTDLKPLANAASDSDPDRITVAGALGLSFLAAFHTTIFSRDLNKVLRPILLDGEFYKRENRTEFTEAYNDLMKLDDTVSKFDSKLSAEGDYGKRYATAKGEIASLPIKRRKIQNVVQEASEESLRIIDTARRAMKTLIQVLNGILKKDPTGHFDTLSNLASFTGKNTPLFTDSIEDTLDKLEKALNLLDEVNILEVGK